MLALIISFMVDVWTVSLLVDGDSTVSSMWPWAEPLHEAASFETAMLMASQPAQGHKISEYAMDIWKKTTSINFMYE